MQAAKMEYKSVYNDKKAEPLRRAMLFVVIEGRGSASTFCEKGLFNSVFTKHHTFT